jgi:hypothetical protein
VCSGACNIRCGRLTELVVVSGEDFNSSCCFQYALVNSTWVQFRRVHKSDS